jgi:hypothetical protein
MLLVQQASFGPLPGEIFPNTEAYSRCNAALHLCIKNVEQRIVNFIATETEEMAIVRGSVYRSQKLPKPKHGTCGAGIQFYDLER